MDLQQDGLVACRHNRRLFDEIYTCFRAVP